MWGLCRAPIHQWLKFFFTACRALCSVDFTHNQQLELGSTRSILQSSTIHQHATTQLQLHQLTMATLDTTTTYTLTNAYTGRTKLLSISLTDNTSPQILTFNNTLPPENA